MNIIIYGMVYLGSILMVYNIYGFVHFARYVKGREKWGKESRILYIPIVLLVLFLIGYLLVGIFGKPDLIIAGILFGGSIFVFVIYRLLMDITERIIQNEKMEGELKAAEESSRIKSSLLAGISHEMRTPMNVILGITGIALQNPELAPETRNQFQKIEQSGKHLLGLINDTLDLQQMNSGELKVKEEPFSLNEMLSQVNAIAGTQCEEKGLSFKTEISGTGDAYIGDAMLLKQVLMSLLDNAVKFTDVPGSVGLSAEKYSDDGTTAEIRFTVSDTGIGMSPEFLPKAFDMFSKEDESPTGRYGGNGLGLANAKNKTELMGGRIIAESKQNVGSVFAVTIPLRIASDDEVSRETKDEAAPVSLEGKRILIVDDIDENAEIVADLLELEGALSDHAVNGKEAVRMFSESAASYYDAILMDLRMPVMDGLEATRRIRALDRPDASVIPIIALTANAFASDMEQTKEAGMNAHLSKPTDADFLYHTLQLCIQNSSSSRRDGR